MKYEAGEESASADGMSRTPHESVTEDGTEVQEIWKETRNW